MGNKWEEAIGSLSGRPLERARSFFETNFADLAREDVTFIQRSIYRNRQLRFAVGSVITVTVLLLASLAGVAGWNWLEAARARRLAELTLTNVAMSLSSASNGHKDRDATYAALIALEALPDEASQNYMPYTEKAELALFNSFQSVSEQRVFGSETCKIARAIFDFVRPMDNCEL